MKYKSKFPYHDGYANLAAAIIESGTNSNDTRFLNSDWCSTLREICALDDVMYGDINININKTSVLKGECDVKLY